MLLTISFFVLLVLLLVVLYKLYMLLEFLGDDRTLQEVVREEQHTQEKGEIFVYDPEQEARDEKFREAAEKGKDIKLVDLLKDDYDV